MGKKIGTGDKGRDMREAGIINRYLRRVEQLGGRTINADALRDRLLRIDEVLAENDITPVQRLLTVQERTDTEEKLALVDDATESEFVEIIKDWAERHGVTYATLRQLNVPADVLRRAGISG